MKNGSSKWGNTHSLRKINEVATLVLILSFFSLGCSKGEEAAADTGISPIKESAIEKTAEKSFVTGNETSSSDAHSSAAEDKEKERKNGVQDLKFESLEPLLPPQTKMKVPNVTVRELKPLELKVAGIVCNAFTDADGRLKYLATDKEIVVFNQSGRVKKQIARKGTPPGNLSSCGAGFSLDGRWVWYSYGKSLYPKDENHKYKAMTGVSEIYDENGNLQWTVPGEIDSLSPDGRKATIAIPELGGMKYIERGWDAPKDIKTMFGGAPMMTSCVFDDGVAIVSATPFPTEIFFLNRRLERIETRRFSDNCMIDACLANINRVLIDCGEIRRAEAVLYIYDSRGKEIARSWFPYMGNRYFSFNLNKKLILVGTDFGESLYLDPKNGEILARIDRIKDLTVWNPPIADRKKQLDITGAFHNAMIGKFLVENILLLDGAIVRLRKPVNPHGAEKRKECLIDAVDFTGNMVFSKKFTIDENTSQASPYLKVPIIWREGKTVRFPIGNKLHVIEAVMEVEQ
jgi:hypothetical protein